MFRYVMGRLLGAALVLFAVSVFTFGIFQILPKLTGTDLALYYTGRNTSPAQAAAVLHKFGFDQPVLQQYWTWLSGIFTGRQLGDGVSSVSCPAPCLGYSFRQNSPVLTLIMQAFPVTLSITAGAAVLWLGLGVGAGVLAAWRRDTLLDRATTVTSLVGISMPAFFSGMIIIYALTSGPEWLRLYPNGINYVPITQDPVGWFTNLLPVWVCLAYLIAAVYTRFARAAMLETLEEDYLLTAQAKGLRPRGVVYHGFRSVLPLIVTLTGLDIGGLLGGAVIIEALFSFPGLGLLAFDALNTKDLPVIMGVTLFSAVLIVLANFAVDLCHPLLDPRVTHGE